MHSLFQGDNQIYRCIATTALEKQLRIRSSHCTFQTDEGLWLACCVIKMRVTAYPEVSICLKA